MSSDDLLEFTKELNGTMPPNAGPPEVTAGEAANSK